MRVRRRAGVPARQELDRQRLGRAGERDVHNFAASEMVRSFDQAGRGAERDVFGAEDNLDSVKAQLWDLLWRRPRRPQTLLAIERDEPVAPGAFDHVGGAEE